MHKNFIQTACLALVLAGCGLLGLDSDESKDPISFDLVLDKTVIAPGERFTATYTTTNRTDKTITFITSCVGYAGVMVYKDEEYVNFHGANFGCLTALGHYEIGPKETLEFIWDIDAFRRTREIGQPNFDTIFVAPGDYTLRLISNIAKMNGKNFSPKPLDVDFRVE